MPQKLPDLAPVTDKRGDVSYRFVNKSDFAYEEWVPTLLGISQAQTYAEQREALRVGVVKVAASSTAGLRPIAGSRVRSVTRNVEARFRFDPDGQPALGFLAAGRVATLGYQSPDETCPHPAFAVLDRGTEGEQNIHEVVRDPSQPLSDAAGEISLRAMYGLAHVLDSCYPGFEIMPKLEEGLANSV